jgi:hypothetical protein
MAKKVKASGEFKATMLQAIAQGKFKGRDKLVANRIKKFRTAAKWDLLEKQVIGQYLMATGKSKVGSWTDFLDWIIKNGPAIVEFIKLIISLFSSL